MSQKAKEFMRLLETFLEAREKAINTPPTAAGQSRRAWYKEASNELEKFLAIEFRDAENEDVSL